VDTRPEVPWGFAIIVVDGSEPALLVGGKFRIACEGQPKTIAPLAKKLLRGALIVQI
jgi:hypothetical protein